MSLLSLAYMLAAIMPSKEDWQIKIDKVKEEYFKVSVNLPRKAKKKRRKELNAEYSILKYMQETTPF